MKWLRAAIVGAMVLGSSAASAETPPSIWDRAKEPEVEDEYQLHLTVQRILLDHELNQRGGPSLALAVEGQLMRALAMLQSAGAEKSQNPLLRFDLAEAFFALKHFSRSVAIYKTAMTDFPAHPLTRHSRFQLALACGHIGDHECESRLYRQIIADGTAPHEIAVSTLNLAEADMHAHDLKEAIEGYREAFRLCGMFTAGSHTPALTLWGLAVALDRAGELREADETASRALSMAGNNIHALHDEDVFFFPDYEVFWYDALTFASAARRAQSPKERYDLWQRAESTMSAWVRGAEKAKEKEYWLPIGKERLATYSAERKRFEAAAAKAGPPADPDESASIHIQTWPRANPPNPGPPGSTPPFTRPPRAPVVKPPPMKAPPPVPKTGDVKL